MLTATVAEPTPEQSMRQKTKEAGSALPRFHVSQAMAKINKLN